MYRDEDEDVYDDDTGIMPAYDSYVAEQLSRPEYRRIKIGLDRVERILGAIASSGQPMSKKRMVEELGFVLGRLQEIEMLAEKIDDILVWEYVIDYIEMLADIRRYMIAELRWEIQSESHCPVSA